MTSWPATTTPRASSAGASIAATASLDIDRVVVYRIVDERIAEIWVHDWDQYAYDEFFADNS